MDACRYGYTDRGSKTFDLSISLALSRGTSSHKGSMHGKAVCDKGGYDGSQHCSSNPRRIWVCNGLSHPDVLSRLQVGGNRGRNNTNPTEQNSSVAWALRLVEKLDRSQWSKQGELSVNRVLDGIRVLDFSRYLAGPYASMLLADMRGRSYPD